MLAGEEPSRRHDDLIPKMPAIWPPSPGYAGNAFLSGSAVVRNAFGPAIHAEVAQWLLGVGLRQSARQSHRPKAASGIALPRSGQSHWVLATPSRR